MRPSSASLLPALRPRSSQLFYGDESEDAGNFEDRNLWSLAEWKADSKVRTAHHVIREGQSREKPTLYGEITFTVWSYAMLPYAMLCDAMQCCAMLCYAMLCYAMLCYAMLRYAMLCCSRALPPHQVWTWRSAYCAPPGHQIQDLQQTLPAPCHFAEGPASATTRAHRPRAQHRACRFRHRLNCVVCMGAHIESRRVARE